MQVGEERRKVRCCTSCLTDSPSVRWFTLPRMNSGMKMNTFVAAAGESIKADFEKVRPACRIRRKYQRQRLWQISATITRPRIVIRRPGHVGRNGKKGRAHLRTRARVCVYTSSVCFNGDRLRRRRRRLPPPSVPRNAATSAKADKGRAAHRTWEGARTHASARSLHRGYRPDERTDRPTRGAKRKKARSRSRSQSLNGGAVVTSARAASVLNTYVMLCSEPPHYIM